jgi:hypothetical protein
MSRWNDKVWQRKYVCDYEVSKWSTKTCVLANFFPACAPLVSQKTCLHFETISYLGSCDFVFLNGTVLPVAHMVMKLGSHGGEYEDDCLLGCDDCPDDEGSKHIRNVGKLLLNYTAQHPRRRSAWYETWSPTLKERLRSKVFENGVLRRIYGPTEREVAGGWRKLHNKKLHNLEGNFWHFRIWKNVTYCHRQNINKLFYFITVLSILRTVSVLPTWS